MTVMTIATDNRAVANDLTYPDLADSVSVYAIDVSSAASPFVNEDNYTITAWGDDSGNHDNTSWL